MSARPIRILVDDTAAFHQVAGIGQYARGVLPAAVRSDPDIDWTVAWARGPGGTAPFAETAMASLAAAGPVRIRPVPLSPAWATRLWFRAGAPLPLHWLARRERPDLVYSPDLAVPPSGTAPRVPTIHDVAFLVCPDLYPPRLLRYLRDVTARQLRTAAHLVTVSEASRQDLIQLAGVGAGRISVVPNGVDERFFVARPPTPAERERLGLPQEYLLTVGTLEPRKNHLGLFAALDRSAGNVDLPLVVVGRPGWGHDAIMRRMAELQAAGRVVYLPAVADADLPVIYAGAAASIYPALYEGFGRPVVESLATGTPVVIHDTPALREAAGEEGIVADATNPDALAIAIGDALIAGQRTGERRACRQAWARRWDWEAAGVLLAATLRRVAG